jgi:hypothetical protein
MAGMSTKEPRCHSRQATSFIFPILPTHCTTMALLNRSAVVCLLRTPPRDRVEVIDHDRGCHIATLHGFPEAAGVVADDGHVLVTNRGAAQVSWIDALSLKTQAQLDTGLRPNGVAFVSRLKYSAVACIGDEAHGPILQVLELEGTGGWTIHLPGRPRWCVTDAAGERIFLAIQTPSMILVARLPQLHDVQQWMLPSAGAHGMDIDHRAGLLYVACDGGALLQVDTRDGTIGREWSLAGVPDATFFNPASGFVHVAIGEPGLVESINPHTGSTSQFPTAMGAKTTALVAPATLYVFSPPHQGILPLTQA